MCLICFLSLVIVVQASNRSVLRNTNLERKQYPVFVHYDDGIAEMVVAGHYDYVNPNISPDTFPLQSSKPRHTIMYLLRINKVMKSDEILAELDRQGLRPATLPELLSFGATYPDKQRAMDIVALTGTWRDQDGYRKAPCLYAEKGHRFLGLLRWDLRWDPDTRVAAVKALNK